jgi:AcrR family transcriptional regulator
MIIVDGEVFLSTSEVASRLGVSPRTILRWHESKPEAMGAVTGMNGRMYFRKAIIDETVQRIFFRATSQAGNDNSARRNAGHRNRAVSA